MPDKGVSFNLTGNDLQDIVSQLLAQDPTFTLDSLNITSAPPVHAAVDTIGVTSPPICCPIANRNFSWTQKYHTINSYKILVRLGYFKCGVDPHSCNRLQCDNGDALFICNDISTLTTPTNFFPPNSKQAELLTVCVSWTTTQTIYAGN